MRDLNLISVINESLGNYIDIDNIEVTFKGTKKKKVNYIYEKEFESIEEFNNRNKFLSKDYRYYIAYGSNLSLAQMDFRCPDSNFEGIANLDNYRLEFRDKFANVIKEDNSQVSVAVYRISERDEKSLDNYEKDYFKREIKINISGREIKGLIYIMKKIKENRETKKIISLPSKNYFNLLRDSYKFFGFKEEILLNSLDRAYKAYYNLENI